MNKDVIFGGIGVVLILAFLFILEDSKPAEYDEFAQCLSEAGAKMYGSKSCPHCNDQKEMFGKSWRYADYIECSSSTGIGQAEECREAGIRAYPTWIFADGSQQLGLMSFEELSEKTGCALP